MFPRLIAEKGVAVSAAVDSANFVETVSVVGVLFLIFTSANSVPAFVVVVVDAVEFVFCDVLEVSCMMLYILFCRAVLNDLVVFDELVVALAFAKGETPFVSA